MKIELIKDVEIWFLHFLFKFRLGSICKIAVF